MKAKRKLVPKCHGMGDGTPGTNMRGVHSTTSYVSENVDIVGEAVNRVASSKRQCVRQMDSQPECDFHNDVPGDVLLVILGIIA
ncbi:hypothetical protein Tco_0984634, partial [Tanacetum coccineum]